VSDSAAAARPRAPLWQKVLPWAITALCFYFLWRRIEGAAAGNGQDVSTYMRQVLDAVRWRPWLALMIPYSLLYLVIDTAVVWRAINWFNAEVRYRDVLPIRASAYIISIFNEQVGKGAIALYMNRRHDIPGWEIGSSMLFIMVCEIYSLLAWATFGWFMAHDTLPPEFDLIPWLAVAGAVVFALMTAFFAGGLGIGAALRERAIFRAFRQASPWHYLGIVLIRAPSILVAVVVYTAAAHLFGIEVGLRQMLGYVPVVFFGAAFPTPMRAVAITLWVHLFSSHAGEASIFGFVQHNFFVFFNAAIGLLFLRRAYRELFESDASPMTPSRQAPPT
jgi:GNAT superfamily N-acetyltransferase